MGNVQFTPSRKAKTAPTHSGVLGPVRHLVQAWFSTLFAVLWPAYAIWEVWHHIHHPNRLEDGWNIIVILLTFVYGVVVWTRLHPQVVYTQESPPPQVVIHEHRHRRRW